MAGFEVTTEAKGFFRKESNRSPVKKRYTYL